MSTEASILVLVVRKLRDFLVNTSKIPPLLDVTKARDAREFEESQTRQAVALIALHMVSFACVRNHRSLRLASAEGYVCLSS